MDLRGCDFTGCELHPGRPPPGQPRGRASSPGQLQGGQPRARRPRRAMAKGAFFGEAVLKGAKLAKAILRLAMQTRPTSARPPRRRRSARLRAHARPRAGRALHQGPVSARQSLPRRPHRRRLHHADLARANLHGVRDGAPAGRAPAPRGEAHQSRPPQAEGWAPPARPEEKGLRHAARLGPPRRRPHRVPGRVPDAPGPSGASPVLQHRVHGDGGGLRAQRDTCRRQRAQPGDRAGEPSTGDEAGSAHWTPRGRPFTAGCPTVFFAGCPRSGHLRGRPTPETPPRAPSHPQRHQRLPRHGRRATPEWRAARGPGY